MAQPRIGCPKMMTKNFLKFFINYLPNLFFFFFVVLVLIMVIIAILDAILGVDIIAAMSDIISPLISYIASFVIVASAFQWIYNLIALSKPDVNKEVKSKWRYFMFLFNIFANVDFYEAFIADKNSDHFRKTRNFLA
jgi:hypothetical protein